MSEQRKELRARLAKRHGGEYVDTWQRSIGCSREVGRLYVCIIAAGAVCPPPSYNYIQ